MPMNSLEKIVWSQDSYFKTEAKNSGETSINLSNEIYEFLGGKHSKKTKIGEMGNLS